MNGTAQSDQAAMGDIVVIVQRRQQRVTDVPISITVGGQGQLECELINTFDDLARIAPSLELAVFGRNLFDVHEPGLNQSVFPYGGTSKLDVIYGQQSFRPLGLQLDAKF